MPRGYGRQVLGIVPARLGNPSGGDERYWTARPVNAPSKIAIEADTEHTPRFAPAPPRQHPRAGAMLPMHVVHRPTSWNPASRDRSHPRVGTRDDRRPPARDSSPTAPSQALLHSLSPAGKALVITLGSSIGADRARGDQTAPWSVRRDGSATARRRDAATAAEAANGAHRPLPPGVSRRRLIDGRASGMRLARARETRPAVAAAGETRFHRDRSSSRVSE